MELDVHFSNKKVSIVIEKPFRLDLGDIVNRIDQMLISEGTRLNGLDVAGLIPLMIKGIAGCEAGCPANAKSLVERGYQNFTLRYVEGGILTATAKVADNKLLTLKLFPDF
jgi:hypothetical protein